MLAGLATALAAAALMAPVASAPTQGPAASSPGPASTVALDVTTDSRVLAAARAVAGRDVVVRCDSAVDVRAEVGWALAWADVAGGVLHLGPYLCEALRDPTSPLFGGGLLGLVHEAVHLTGDLNESSTECKALAALPDVATRFWGIRDLRPVLYAAQRLHALTPADYHC